MHPFILYIIRTIIISAILYGWYYAALGNKKLHSYNRVYLLGIIVCSLLFPLFHIGWQVSATTKSMPLRVLQVINATGGEQESITATHVGGVSITQVCLLIYGFIALCMLSVLSANVLRLYKIRKNAPVTRTGHINIIRTSLKQAPFSFLNNLFWNDNIAIDSDAGSRIMKHELTHIQLGHSWDKLFTRVVLAFFWMNPLFWMIQSELAMVHEFQADEGAISDNDTTAFAEMLLSAHLGSRYTTLIQPFFHSPIKRRLIMMNQEKRPMRLRMAMALPLAAATILLFSFTPGRPVSKAKHETVVIIDAGHGGKDAGAISSNGIQEKELTLLIAKRIAQLAPEYNVKVVSTRSSDDYPTLEDRAALAAKTHADLFVSIHVNKNTAGEKHEGYEMYVCDKNMKYAESRRLASAIASELSAAPETIQQKGLIVLKQNTVPGVLLECGNIDVAGDMGKIKDASKLEQMCRQILAGIAKYQNSK